MRIQRGDQPLPSWQFRAACRSGDLELFFAPDGERPQNRVFRERQAKAVCERCPVVSPCAHYAIATGEPHGIWGGLTEAERDALRRVGRTPR
jgi:WhiB family redox-sensing transcriptional regulator